MSFVLLWYKKVEHKGLQLGKCMDSLLKEEEKKDITYIKQP